MKITLEKMDDYTASKKRRPTPDQWKAISLEGTDILVAAAAGSGKTEVLSERISRKVAKKRWDISRLLVLTFTTAAAKNMLERIENKIESYLLHLNTESAYEHLKRQRLLMNEAQVTTIDSFCLSILKQFYYLVEEEINGEIKYLSPNFKILANNKQLLEETVEEVIEQFANTNKSLLDTVFHIFEKKEDVIEFFRITYSSMLSIPNYKNYILNDLTKNLDYLVGEFDYVSLNNQLTAIEVGKSSSNLTDFNHIISRYRNYLENSTSNDEKIITVIKNAQLTNDKKDYLTRELASLEIELGLGTSKLKTLELIDKIEKEDGSLKELTFNISELKTVINIYAKIQNFSKVTKEILLAIDNRFKAKKRADNYLDFADLNHLAINALEKNINGKLCPTEASEYYRKLFLEIYVDEYQDNNDLQEYILNLIRGEDTTYFRVGDVKQAIYGFRGSNPELFEDKYQKYIKLSELISEDDYSVNSDYNLETSANGICVVLKENFRSENNVLQSSNYIFNRLMFDSNAGISYDEDSALYFPKVKEKSKTPVPTYIIAPQGEKEKIDNEKAIHTIAKEILTSIEENNTTFKDYAILVRKTKNIEAYKEVLDLYGIPVYYREKEGFVDSHSFNILYSILKFLDNQSNDIELLIILKSEIFNYSNDQLVELSLIEESNLYKKMLKSTKSKDKETINILHKWINYSLNYSPYETIKTISNDINFVNYMTTFSINDEEVDYYENFLDLLAETSQNSINLSYTLNKLKKIVKIEEYETKRKVPSNSVTISSIHISKGLEYKYVFVAGLEKDIIGTDYTGSIIYSKELGIVPNIVTIYDKKDRQDLNLLYDLNSLLIKKKIYEEEVRNLYVALTRAEKELYLVSLKPIILSGEETYTKQQIKGKFLSSKNYSEMLNSVLTNYPQDLTVANEVDAKFETKNFVESINVEESEKLNKNILLSDIMSKTEKLEKGVTFIPINENNKKHYYPLKTSYSALKKINKVRDEEQEKTEKLTKKDYLLFGTSNKNSSSVALLRGNAVHKLFEAIIKDIRSGNEIDNIPQYLENKLLTEDIVRNIKEQRVLSEEEYVSLNNEKDY